MSGGALTETPTMEPTMSPSMTLTVMMDKCELIASTDKAFRITFIVFGILYIIIALLLLGDVTWELKKRKEMNNQERSSKKQRYFMLKLIEIIFHINNLILGSIIVCSVIWDNNDNNSNRYFKTYLLSKWINKILVSIYVSLKLDAIWNEKRYKGKGHCLCIPYTLVIYGITLLLMCIFTIFFEYTEDSQNSGMCSENNILFIFYSGYNIVILIFFCINKINEKRIIILLWIFFIVLITRVTMVFVFHDNSLIMHFLNDINILFNIIFMAIMNEYTYDEMGLCLYGNIDDAGNKSLKSVHIPVNSVSQAINPQDPSTTPSDSNNKDNNTTKPSKEAILFKYTSLNPDEHITIKETEPLTNIDGKTSTYIGTQPSIPNSDFKEQPSIPNDSFRLTSIPNSDLKEQPSIPLYKHKTIDAYALKQSYGSGKSLYKKIDSNLIVPVSPRTRARNSTTSNNNNNNNNRNRTSTLGTNTKSSGNSMAPSKSSGEIKEERQKKIIKASMTIANDDGWCPSEHSESL